MTAPTGTPPHSDNVSESGALVFHGGVFRSLN
jgi:hypothetical protein